MSVEPQVLADSAKKSGDVVERMVVSSEVDRKRNQQLVKRLARSLCILIKHHVSHTTSFEDIIHIQINNRNEQLEEHLCTAPSNATYLSKVTTAELLSSISHCNEASLLARLNCSEFISIMANESTNVSRNKSCPLVAEGLRMESQLSTSWGLSMHMRCMQSRLHSICVSFSMTKVFLSKRCVG